MKKILAVLSLTLISAIGLFSLGIAYAGGIRGIGLLGVWFFLTFGIVIVLAQLIRAKEPIMIGESLSELKHLVVLPCSGPCNVGQLANQAAVDLTRAGHGMMFNLPGLAAHRPLFVQAAQEMARNMVVVDGCSVGCARSVVEHLGIPV